MMQHQEDPTFHVDAEFDDQDNHLARLCWMRPSQQVLWSRFYDIIFIDTTTKMNRHGMILYIIILVDNHNCFHLAVTTLLSDETKDSFV